MPQRKFRRGASVPATPVSSHPELEPMTSSRLQELPGESNSRVTESNNRVSMSDLKVILQSVPTASGSDLDILIKFILEVDLIVFSPFLSPIELLKGLSYKTEGPLRDWWISQITPDRTWLQMKTLLLNEFTTPIDRAILAQRFINRRQNISESFPDYVEDILKYIALLGSELSEPEIISRIWINQNEQTFNHLQFREPPSNISDLRLLLKHLRAVERQRVTYKTNSDLLRVPSTSVVICRYCKQPGHYLVHCPVRPPRPSFDPKAILPSNN